MNSMTGQIMKPLSNAMPTLITWNRSLIEGEVKAKCECDIESLKPFERQWNKKKALKWHKCQKQTTNEHTTNLPHREIEHSTLVNY